MLTSLTWLLSWFCAGVLANAYLRYDGKKSNPIPYQRFQTIDVLEFFMMALMGYLALVGMIFLFFSKKFGDI